MLLVLCVCGAGPSRIETYGLCHVYGNVLIFECQMLRGVLTPKRVHLKVPLLSIVNSLALEV